MSTPLSILQVNTFERWGGAETVAVNLCAALRGQGHEVTLAVGRKASDDPHVVELPNDQQRGVWGRSIHGLARMLGASPHSPWVDRAADPRRLMDDLSGREPFDHPGTAKLLDLPARRPDVLHLHNLHGNYFDLRQLAQFSKQTPTFMTLHDSWLMTGHCAYTLGCERWQTGCGQCPDLSIYPELWRDATAGNRQRKQAIYRKSRLNIATPSQWLMDMVTSSILTESDLQTRVIPYGIDQSIYHPGSPQAARDHLGLAQDHPVLLFAASGLRANRFKDYQTLRRAIERVGECDTAKSLTLIALGDDAPDELVGHIKIRFVPFESDPKQVARYFQAADLYLHAAKADNFPCVVLEALSCGTPVIATAVGGVPEQVRGMEQVGPEQATGALVPAGDDQALANAITSVLSDRPLLKTLAENAARDAAERFTLARQADDYLAWYHERLQEQPVAEAHP